MSIVVPCRNEAQHIRACLGSILAQEPLPDGRTFEVLVADGMSDDGTRETIAAVAAVDPRVRLIDNPRRIVSTGLNNAIRAARGDVIVRMDAHTQYAPDYVRQCVAVLHQTGADNVGGPQRAEARGYVQRAICAAHHSPFAVGGARSHDRQFEGQVDTVIYGCWRRETLLAIGLFDEELVRNQDDEMNFRIVRRGGRVWQSPRIRSVYTPRASLGALFRQYLQYGYWKVRVIQKHKRPAAARHLAPMGFTLGAAFGWLAGFVSGWFWVLYAGVWALYLLASLAAALRAAARDGWDLLPVLPPVFLVYHVAYGVGFTWGLLDFVVLRWGVSPRMTVLTRPSG